MTPATTHNTQTTGGLRTLQIIPLLILLLLPLAANAFNYTDPKDFPATIPPNRLLFDMTDALSPSQQQDIEHRLRYVRQQTSVPIVTVIISSCGDYTIADFAERLFSRWKIGYDGKDNGILLLIATQQHKAFIATGYGIEPIITDADATLILKNNFVPEMRKGNPYGAIDSTINSLTAKISADPAIANDVTSKSATQTNRDAPLDNFDFWQAIYFICSLVFLISAILFIIGIIKTRGKDKYFKALYWRGRLSLFCTLALFSAGSALIFAIPVFMLYRRARDKRLKCETCGAKMKKLSESEDNELLSAAQDLEEQLGTVDYDVWVCPKCGTIERFPFRQEQKEYTECPACHTIATKLVCNKIIQRPTPRTEGIGEKIYECKYCGKQQRRHYRIPPTDSGNGAGGALIAGALLGSMLGSSHSNGNGSGGFTAGGGGMTGGGGGGISW